MYMLTNCNLPDCYPVSLGFHEDDLVENFEFGGLIGAVTNQVNQTMRQVGSPHNLDDIRRAQLESQARMNLEMTRGTIIETPLDLVMHGEHILNGKDSIRIDIALKMPDESIIYGSLDDNYVKMVRVNPAGIQISAKYYSDTSIFNSILDKAGTLFNYNRHNDGRYLIKKGVPKNPSLIYSKVTQKYNWNVPNPVCPPTFKPFLNFDKQNLGRCHFISLERAVEDCENLNKMNITCDAVVRDGVGYETRSIKGTYQPDTSIGSVTYFMKEKNVVAPTIAPVVAPVVAPTIAPVVAPIVAPVVAPVVAPTIAPIITPPQSGDVIATRAPDVPSVRGDSPASLPPEESIIPGFPNLYLFLIFGAVVFFLLIIVFITMNSD